MCLQWEWTARLWGSDHQRNHRFGCRGTKFLCHRTHCIANQTFDAFHKSIGPRQLADERGPVESVEFDLCALGILSGGLGNPYTTLGPFGDQVFQPLT